MSKSQQQRILIADIAISMINNMSEPKCLGEEHSQDWKWLVEAVRKLEEVK